MKPKTIALINEILENNKLIYLSENLKSAVEKTVEKIKNGGKIVVCGNGGSAADSVHIVGELLKSFILPRNLSEKDKEAFSVLGEDGVKLSGKLQYGIPAIALSGSEAISTAIINDTGAEMVFAQQTQALLNDKDVFIGISTSGNAEDIRLAMLVAKVKGAFTIALTGKDGGKLKEIADVSIIVNERETYLIQEKHLPIYHLYCMCLENELFGD